MPPSTPNLTRWISVLSLLGLGVLGSLAGCTKNPRTPAEPPPLAHALTDASRPAFQIQLLDLAFETASLIPNDPHHKDRARFQELVALASLELGLPNRARTQIAAIENWRRGAGYAELAEYAAHAQNIEEAERALATAREIADAPPSNEVEQEWRRDRIRALIARTESSIAKAREGKLVRSRLGESEAAALEAAKARAIAPDDLESYLVALERGLVAASLDQVQATFAAYTTLHERFYGDAPRRDDLARRVSTHYAQLPVQLRMESTLRMGETALAHQDKAGANRYAQTARETLESARWLPEHKIPLLAQVAALRHRAGDLELATKEAEEARALFAHERLRITDIYRARALRPLAEAWYTMGDRDRATQVYRLLLEEGAVNPNSRPRAEDLCATCVSMARVGFEPSAEVWRDLRASHAALGSPW